MEKHIILLDLDGTLLKSDKTISDYNIKVLKKVRELGHEVVIVTGRAYYRSSWYYDILGLDGIIFNRNGGHIHHPLDPTFAKELDTLTKEAIAKVMKEDLFEKYIDIHFESENTLYCVKGDRSFYENPQYVKLTIKDCEDYREIEPVSLISFTVNAEDADALNAYFSTIDGIYVENFRFNNGRHLHQIYPRLVNKSKAVHYLHDHFQVPYERIMAFGDERNDYEMLKTVGIGVAMLNGNEDVKKVAKYITAKTNDESGVGDFINQYFNLGINE